MNLEELSDKELFDELEKSGLAEKLENDPTWKLVREAGDRIVERAIRDFALNVKSDDHLKILELQVIIRKYKYGLLSEINFLKQESDSLFEEANGRGFFDKWKKS